ncbi:glycosyltransferase family 1 protein [Pseudodesulfovibrio sp. JC047]|uniref:glycosyltransferase family 4 protein n=1 Tax=Pseudodesulfovibrio sp. JC047 TaxID=2683199 RepID=UPI0013D5E34E|nr:glycosyltransferase family 4 protein [Pseudodesulfovibrio sp. JC047]NDV18366.1 glycosyltransferase family 1 protein [Pseudodesulfovibrio sp. JC047]
MKTCIFLPPVNKPTGGVTVLRQVADILHQAGKDVRLVARETSGWRPDGLADAAPVIEWADLHLTSDDIWMIPEGWVNALAPGLEAKAHCLNYVQNWAYLFSALPEGVDWHNLPVEFLAVSDPVSHYIKKTTFKDAPIIRPGIDRSIFYPPDKKPTRRFTVAFMPRKNKALIQQIKAIVEHRIGPNAINWLPIQGMSTHQVADALRSAHIFLATGFPEGCPLPPLEAMACGCLPVGFTGFGGWDYMRHIQSSPRFTPWIDLREVDWAGNGFWCADGDVLDAALCLEDALDMLKKNDLYLAAALESGQETADAYSSDTQKLAVLEAWDAF